MGRIEWTRYEGNDVEAVVAMLVNRVNPNSTRITPSRGDGGVDILHRGGGPDGGDEVIQVKRYTGPLDTKQKDAVEESLQRLVDDPRWAELKVTRWVLVTPWDPTPEAEAWLQEVGGTHQLQEVVWRGLTYVDSLGATFPEVADYYLHGGRSLIEDTYKSVISLMGVGNGPEDLNVSGVVERVKKALPVLQGDPHYRYELRFGEGDLPALGGRSGLVMSVVSRREGDTSWAIVDVIARCAVSVEERPITIQGKLTAKPGSDFEASLRDFVSHGTPFVSPDDSFSGSIDAPGGLGGTFHTGRVTSLPPLDAMADVHLHVQLVNPDGDVIATADLDRMAMTRGNEGVRIVLEEIHHVFIVEDRYSNDLKNNSRSVRFGNFQGEPVGSVDSALQFLLKCRAPNRGRVSLRGTPAELGSPDAQWAFPAGSDFEAPLRAISAACATLATLQRHTRQVIRTPDFSSLEEGQLEDWRIAAKIVDGGEVRGTYPDGHALLVELAAEIDEPGQEFVVDLPLTVTVGAHMIDLGRMELVLSSPTLIERRPSGDHVEHAFTTPDRAFVYRR